MNIELQVLGSSLRSIAEEMGAILIRSAFSANIKERRDCSTALFDERGRMIAQAEHIPVHLGSLPDAVAVVRELGVPIRYVGVGEATEDLLPFDAGAFAESLVG